MWSPKARRTRVILVVLGLVGVLVIGAVAGGVIVGTALFGGGGSAPVSVAPVDAGRDSAPLYSGGQAPLTGSTEEAGVEQKATSPASDAAATAGPMLVKSARMDLRVEKVPAGMEGVRAVVRRYPGAQITDYAVSNGDIAGPVEPYAEAAAPSTASMTIRVPADDLEPLRADLAKVGQVLTESSSASDVTQQYVDMDARLKNLRAEEARLRDFLTRTDKVSELLQVESELSRVRGEIESMQAQLDYLSKQVDLSTLTVNLSEPGAVVRPQGVDWGFREALTRGVQGAAAVLTFLMTATIALLPLAVIVTVLVLVVRALVRRSRRNRPAPAGDAEGTPSQGAE